MELYTAVNRKYSDSKSYFLGTDFNFRKTILLFWGTLSWVFIERTDVEGETAILWPPDAKS